ncbi:hypothetical protein LIER_29892 [Lithospermum erythrorhizon]|uniref:Secreted protein n=1 Tax=Lithospermum erythrorhizon TaxID=34254 RepID=A0AAV3RKS0_LITER
MDDDMAGAPPPFSSSMTLWTICLVSPCIKPAISGRCELRTSVGVLSDPMLIASQSFGGASSFCLATVSFRFRALFP